MNTLANLRKITSRSDLATFLGYRPRQITYILYVIPEAEKYEIFEIPKKTGGSRQISAPILKLKKLQRTLAALLQQCYEELHTRNTNTRALSHGFRKGHSIITNAKLHTNRRYVFNVDLEDFFPSINFGRVRGFFIKDRDFQLHPDVATAIAQISCHENELPQGSPASPIISNLIGHILDLRLVRLAKKCKCTYSRYADDITFSTREKTFPELIAKPDSGIWIPSDQLVAAVQNAGFRLNAMKVSMQYHTNRQMTTGLVVNRKVNVPSSYYRRARAMCNALFSTGAFDIRPHVEREPPKEDHIPIPGSIHQLRGILGHIHNVKKHHVAGEPPAQRNKLSGILKLVRKFGYFDNFHMLDKPLILCEGKTDSVHIKCALKSLATEFPRLIDVSDLKMKVKFYNYSKFNMHTVNLQGGTGDFGNLIGQYEKMMRSFRCPGRQFPVVLIVDRDDGMKNVVGSASKVSGRKIDIDRDFNWLLDNLYLTILPPHTDKAMMEIEDYLPDWVKLVELNGKRFEPDEKKFSRDRHYSKMMFAKQVVKEQQETIDFGDFRKLLKCIDSAIMDYESRKSQEIL